MTRNNELDNEGNMKSQRSAESINCFTGHHITESCLQEKRKTSFLFLCSYGFFRWLRLRGFSSFLLKEHFLNFPFLKKLTCSCRM